MTVVTSTPCLRTGFRRRVKSAILCTVALSLPSCGTDRKPVFPVSGVVLVNGEPASGLFVRFHPLDSPGATQVPPFAYTDESGRFALCSYVAGDGAPPGDYAVTFQWREPSGALKRHLDGGDRLKGAFKDPDASSFRVQVKKGSNKLEPFDLKTQ